jgi:hypothetical protein
MWLTRLFVARPTLVTVFLALVMLAGSIGGRDARAAAVPEHRRALDPSPGQLSRRVDDGHARRDRAPARRSARRHAQPRSSRDLDSARRGVDRRRLPLTSDQNDDLVQVQGRVQNAQHSLPNDVQTPQISLYNPSEAVVVVARLRSRVALPGDLSSLAINKIVPALEQITGVSFVQENGTVTPSIQVNVNPKKRSRRRASR